MKEDSRFMGRETGIKTQICYVSSQRAEHHLSQTSLRWKAEKMGNSLSGLQKSNLLCVRGTAVGQRSYSYQLTSNIIPHHTRGSFLSLGCS